MGGSGVSEDAVNWRGSRVVSVGGVDQGSQAGRVQAGCPGKFAVVSTAVCPIAFAFSLSANETPVAAA